MNASKYIDNLAKIAGYLKKIKCEKCGFEGVPLNDGRCPDCGALGGIMPKSKERVIDNDYSKDLSRKEFFDHIENAVNDINIYI